jgi:long-subunit fatty acid transport protein
MTNAFQKQSILLTLLIFSSTHAWAFSYTDNRGLLPIGEVESFMANTGAALSGSTGAVYYNPAGLASIDRHHISLSANSYLSTRSEVNPIQTIDGVDMNFSTKGLQAIPTSFVSTGQHEQWRYAFSV